MYYLRWEVYEVHGIHDVNKMSLGKVTIIPLMLCTLCRFCLLRTLLGFGGGLFRGFVSCVGAAGWAWLGRCSKLNGGSSREVSKSGIGDDSTCLVMRVSDMIVRIRKLTSMKFW